MDKVRHLASKRGVGSVFNFVNKNRATTAIIVAFLFVLGAYVFSLVNHSGYHIMIDEAAGKKVVAVKATHKTYDSLDSLMADSALKVVISGTVLSSTVGNHDSDLALVALVTEYKIKVKSVLVGGKLPSSITVSVPEGVIDDTFYDDPAIPNFKIGQSIVAFLDSGKYGVYNPLSKGAAVATSAGNGEYKLSNHVISPDGSAFTVSDIITRK